MKLKEGASQDQWGRKGEGLPPATDAIDGVTARDLWEYDDVDTGVGVCVCVFVRVCVP